MEALNTKSSITKERKGEQNGKTADDLSIITTAEKRGEGLAERIELNQRRKKDKKKKNEMKSFI